MSSSTPTRIEHRKLRRGTTSCWECKRRKTRCHFEQSSASVCVSCKRRGSKCVLQHIEEHALATQAVDQLNHRPNAGERMEHLESMVDRLVHQSTAPTASNQNSSYHLNRNNSAPQVQRSKSSSNPPRKLLPKLDKALARSSNCSPDNGSKSLISSAHQSLLSPDPTSGSPRCSSLTLLLQSILPSVSITTRIMHHNKVLMMSMHVFRGLSSDPFRLAAPPRQITRPSSSTPNPKPIDLARSLFQLAICLQQSERTSEISELCLDRSNTDVAGQYFEAASRYVTSQDALVVSPEGIETLMLEGLYHVSTGQTRLAWLVFRRALSIAQLMGLHIPQVRRQNKQREATNGQTPICLKTLWFRLIFMDRYMALVLCLPMSIKDDSFMQDSVPTEPYEKMERIQAVLTSRIISRNELMRHGQLRDELSYNHYDETKDIDYELKRAARSLPAEWWAFPRLKDANTNAELKDMTVKVVLQMHYYNLVLLLHLPYVVPRIRDSLIDEAAPDYTNSKISAMFASRELLTRSIVPVGPNRVTSSNRGNSLKIILSALNLLLSHLDSHRLGRENALDHQRPGDLLLVERAISSLDTVFQKHDDALCASAAQALKKLSAIETSAADGLSYRAWSEPSEVMEMECTVREEADSIEMEFPYMGIIHILRHDSPEGASRDAIGSRTAAETGNLDGSDLTSSWPWSDSPLSLLPELASTASSVDDTHDAFHSMLSSAYGMQETWGLQSSNLKRIDEVLEPQQFLQDLDFTDGV
ncbi:transcriptional regulator family: Fungal Specific TF [Trichoderma aggressivum f. europaeum]|uniref:Transcriptional regulator family: Fungal Specific TF n=1 Tax=Trichoderma aggressivum f. europaeum TaxID=173218 RepID=A0AAE1IB29_9HYPO|nr:transcriptional regulator family: Fungal Specific TF [Trichoderma aggressivum f. europaeum]